MPASERCKLKTFGKNRREKRVKTVYDDEGNWVSHQHQDQMRSIHNALLDRYYNELQNLGCVRAGEAGEMKEQEGSYATAKENGTIAWEKEMALFRQPLPTTLWVADTDPLAPEVRRYFESMDPAVVQPIPWYPLPGMAWRILVDKTEFRKRGDLSDLRQYLIRQTSLGTISRQEEVSMIPPFLLDIQPTDVCLDMCASPGSKTAQMLVALGRQKMVAGETGDSPFPFDYEGEGLIVANELDTKRANMLVHQVKRLRLLFPFALFTNHDARYFPEIFLRSADSPPSAMRFDKILCDVVCSGDGTMRKAPHIFKVWSPREGIHLQRTQIQISLRACHLLKVGGRLVYSTCSLNPIENEAVVTQLVHRTNGAMQLVDARGLLHGLETSPGMTTWKVMDIKGNVVSTPNANMHEALFPPHTPGGYASEAVNQLDLSLCMRLFPSHCNGGGFFIAVLDKVKEYRLMKRQRVPTTVDGAEDTLEAVDSVAPDVVVASSKVGKGNECDESDLADMVGQPPVTKGRSVPPQFVSAPETIVAALRDFYEISNFPVKYLVVRTANGERDLRLSTSSVCSIVAKSALQVLQQKEDSLVVVAAGLRILAHESLDKGWRISSEAAVLFARLMQRSSRLIRVPMDLVKKLIREGGKLKEMPIEAIEDEAIRAQVCALSVGTVLLEIDCPAAVGGRFYTVALRARSRIQLLVDHEDIVGMQLRLGMEPLAVLESGDSTFGRQPLSDRS